MITKEINNKIEQNSISLYLKEIGYSPLLTAKEEISLALQVKQGDKQAKTKFIESNLRLVVKTAKQYPSKGGMDFIDLVSEGNLGLIHAVDKFDPSKGFRFSTYAVYWIKQCIERALMNQSRTIRVPVHILKELNNYKRAFRELSKQLQNEPSQEEVASFLDRPVEDIKKLLDITKTQDSLDVNYLNSKNSIVNNISDNNKSSVEDDEYSEKIRSLLSCLNSNEKAVICMRYGLCGYDQTTLEEVGREVLLTRERIRQIQVAALKKLAHAASEQHITLAMFSAA
jgi:RNA polymerase nonessential primary-like sigma factor